MSDLAERTLEKIREIGLQMGSDPIATATVENASRIVLETVLDDGGVGRLTDFCLALEEAFGGDILSLLTEKARTSLGEVLEVCILLEREKKNLR